MAMKTAFAGIFLVALLATQAAAFSQTEFHLQYGKHKNPFSATAHTDLCIYCATGCGMEIGGQLLLYRLPR